jgi:hypothetical protein
VSCAAVLVVVLAKPETQVFTVRKYFNRAVAAVCNEPLR